MITRHEVHQLLVSAGVTGLGPSGITDPLRDATAPLLTRVKDGKRPRREVTDSVYDEVLAAGGTIPHDRKSFHRTLVITSLYERRRCRRCDRRSPYAYPIEE